MANRNLCEPWTGFTQFTICDRILLTDNSGPGNGLQQSKQPQEPNISGQKFRTECQRQLNEKKKQQRAIEKPKLDNARKLRGVCFIDLDEKEFKETMTKRAENLESLMEAAMLCKLEACMHPRSSRVYTNAAADRE